MSAKSYDVITTVFETIPFPPFHLKRSAHKYLMTFSKAKKIEIYLSIESHFGLEWMGYKERVAIYFSIIRLFEIVWDFDICQSSEYRIL